MYVPGNGLETVDRSSTLPAIPRPNSNFHPTSGLHPDTCVVAWPSSTEGLTGCPSRYNVSGPRSRRLSWMLLRALLAMITW